MNRKPLEIALARQAELKHQLEWNVPYDDRTAAQRQCYEEDLAVWNEMVLVLKLREAQKSEILAAIRGAT